MSAFSPSISDFCVTVFEHMKRSYMDQKKSKMRVATVNQGGAGYVGPEIKCKECWLHVHTFHFIMPSKVTVYGVMSLNNTPHYQVPMREWKGHLDNVTIFCNIHRPCKLKIHTGDSNYQSYK